MTTALNIMGMVPAAAQLLASLIIGVQHLAANRSGDEKRRAVAEIAAPVLTGIAAFAPGASQKVAHTAETVEPAVQAVFDLIRVINPQALGKGAPAQTQSNTSQLPAVSESNTQGQGQQQPQPQQSEQPQQPQQPQQPDNVRPFPQ